MQKGAINFVMDRNKDPMFFLTIISRKKKSSAGL